MPTTPLAVVTAMYEARAAKDMTAMLAFCADDIVHVFNVDPDRDGSGDVLVGMPATLEHMRRIKEHWEEQDYRLIRLREDGDRVFATVNFTLKHRKSGLVIESQKRQEWKVDTGVVTALFETLDRNLLDAFRRMADTED